MAQERRNYGWSPSPPSQVPMERSGPILCQSTTPRPGATTTQSRRLGGIDPLGFQNTTGLPETRRVVVVAS